MEKHNYEWGDGNTATILEAGKIIIKKECILPGSGELWHFHKSTHQWFLKISGELLIQTQKEMYHLEDEGCVSIPPMIAHKIWNASAGPAEFYLVSDLDTGQDKFLLEYEYPSIDQLNFTSGFYTVKRLEPGDSEILSALLRGNEAHFSSPFPTCYTTMQDAPAILVEALLQDRLIPFGLYHDGEIVGYIPVKKIVKYPGSWEIAYWLDGKCGDKNILTDVLKQFILELALKYGVRNFETKVNAGNLASISFLNKLSFEKKESTGDDLIFATHAKIFIRNYGAINVICHSATTGRYFKQLNEEWIGEFFVLEEADRNVLNNPEEWIIDKGGEIFYAQLNGEIIATGAVMPLANGTFELTKMATAKKYQGLGFGELIIMEAIKWSKQKNLPYLVLYTQSTLFKALHLYEKYGFQREPIDTVHYKRADVKMKLML